jgi:hypothetical protein
MADFADKIRNDVMGGESGGTADRAMIESFVEQIENANGRAEAAEILAPLDDDTIIEIRKRMNPYSKTLKVPEAYSTFAWTSITRKYDMRFVTTGLIGFLYQWLDEYNSDMRDDAIENPIQNPNKHQSPYDPFEVSDFNESVLEKTDDHYADTIVPVTKIKSEIKLFLDSLLEYNPNLHVRDAINKKGHHDPERQTKKRAVKKKRKQRFGKNRPKNQEGLKKALEDARLKNNSLDVLDEKMHEEAVGDNLDDNGLNPERLSQEEMENGEDLVVDSAKELADTTEEEIAPISDLNPAWNVIPSGDNYHRFQIYLDRNFEEIREVVKTFYCEKPDIEDMINPFRQFATEDEATAWKDKHQREFRSSIYVIKNGSWCVLGQFKENRKRAKVYNKDTRILQAMEEQGREDEKLSADMVKKRVKVAKKKNIKREGPDDLGFREQLKDNKPEIASKYGVKATNLEEEEEEEDECPDDAVEVNVIHIGEGGGKLTATKFYTEAEEPDVEGMVPGPNGAIGVDISSDVHGEREEAKK